MMQYVAARLPAEGSNGPKLEVSRYVMARPVLQSYFPSRHIFSIR